VKADPHAGAAAIVHLACRSATTQSAHVMNKCAVSLATVTAIVTFVTTISIPATMSVPAIAVVETAAEVFVEHAETAIAIDCRKD